MLTLSRRARKSVLALFVLVALDLAIPQVPGAFTLDTSVDTVSRARDRDEAPCAERLVAAHGHLGLSALQHRELRLSLSRDPDRAEIWRPATHRPPDRASDAPPRGDDD